MPIYKLQGPDGKVYTVEGPDGATVDELGAFVSQQAGAHADNVAAETAKMRKEYDPTIGMSGADKFLAGAGKAIVDTGRGLGQLVGAVSRDDVAESRERDSALMHTGAGMTGNIAGNVGMALAPGGLLKGAAAVAKAVPALASAAPMLSAAGGAAMAPSSIPAALAIGAVQGAIQPSTSTHETLQNTGIGAAASAAMPVVMRAGQVAKSFVDPLYEGGQRKIMGNALRSVAGNQADDAAAAMKSAAPLVPGSVPTAAEAARNPGIAALQRAAIAADPVATNELTLRQVAQNEARNAALEAVAPSKTAAVAARDAAARPLYAAADQAVVPADAALKALLARMPGGHHNGVVQDAMELARISGEPLKIGKDIPASVAATVDASGAPILQDIPGEAAQYSGKALHYIKLALDNSLSKTGDSAYGDATKRAITGLKNDYLGYLDNAIPAYGQARTTYATMSKPITQADVVGEIAAKGRDFRGNLTPSAYARALRDQTVESVTGQPGATLAKVMDPAQLDTLNAIKSDLMRRDFADTAGRGVGSNTVQNLAYTNMLDKAGIPSMLRNFGPAGVVGNVLGRAGDLAYKKANTEMSQKLAMALLDPQEAASLMGSGMVTPQMQALADALRRGGASLGAASPYLLNAQKQ
jgi:hypothetical protein